MADWIDALPAGWLGGEPVPDAGTGIPEADALLARGSWIGVGPAVKRMGRDPATGEPLVVEEPERLPLGLLIPGVHFRAPTTGARRVTPIDPSVSGFFDRLLPAMDEADGLFLDPDPDTGVVRVWRVSHDPAEIVLVARSLHDLAIQGSTPTVGGEASHEEADGVVRIDFSGPTPVTLDLERFPHGIGDARRDGDALIVEVEAPIEPVRDLSPPPPPLRFADPMEHEPDPEDARDPTPVLIVLVVLGLIAAMMAFDLLG